MSVFPWHQGHLDKALLRPEFQSILITADPGQGAERFATAFSHRLFCESSCGHCKHCNWMAEGDHPDVIDARPEGKSHSHSIDSIRTLIEGASLSTLSGKPRLIRIFEADRMNVQASNALLKFLEEPPPSTRFMLVTEVLGKLLPTVRSRCRTLVLPPMTQSDALFDVAPASTQLKAALEIARAPEVVLALADDPQALKARQDWREALQKGATGSRIEFFAKSLPLSVALDDWYALCVERLKGAEDAQRVKLAKFSDLLNTQRRGVLAQVALDPLTTLHGLHDLWVRALR